MACHETASSTEVAVRWLVHETASFTDEAVPWLAHETAGSTEEAVWWLATRLRTPRQGRTLSRRTPFFSSLDVLLSVTG